jgi:hypothetical protein
MAKCVQLVALPVLLVLPSIGLSAQSREGRDDARGVTNASSVHEVLYDRDQAELALIETIGERRRGKIEFLMQSSGDEKQIRADCDVIAARGKRTQVEVVPQPSSVICRFASDGRRLPAQLALGERGGKRGHGALQVGEFKYRSRTVKIMAQPVATAVQARHAAPTYLFEIDGSTAGSVEFGDLPKIHIKGDRDETSQQAMMIAATALAVLSMPGKAKLARAPE